MSTISNKNSFVIVSWAVVVGSKGCMWEVAASVWAFAVAMGITIGAMWDVADVGCAEAKWDVSASVWSVSGDM